jgi:Aromatic acid exporter family member 1
MKTSASLVTIRGEIPWKTVLLRSARTAVAAIASLLIARCCRLPETYCAPITTLVVRQSSLRETASNSEERLIGTALAAIAPGLSLQVAMDPASSCSASVFLFWDSHFGTAPRSERLSIRGNDTRDRDACPWRGLS